MLTIQNLSVQYNKNVVLQNITVNFIKGKIYGIFGFNGSGKTTFFNIIYGSIEHFNGQIQYNSLELTKKRIAYLESELYFYSYITGREYLSIFKNKDKQIFDIMAIASLFNLPLNELVDSYSLGMKKKLAILGILSLDKSIYIFDEPFNGLDVESIFIVKSIIKVLKDKNKLVLLSSHLIDSLSDICDSFFCIERKTFSSELSQRQFLICCDEIYRNFNKRILETVIQ